MTERRSGKAWATASLFRHEEPAVEGRREDAGASGGWLQGLRVGESRREGDLEVAPLLAEGAGAPPGLLLTRQAVEAGLLEIVERGEGVVQELLAWNRGDRPVAILEGDTLVGCKQNRVVAHSVIVAPGTSLGVPVGCMEQGRWARETRRFAPGATSYLVGQHRGARTDGGRRAEPAEWLARIQAAGVGTRPGLGLGVDLEVAGPGVAGVGLALDGRLVHVAVFAA
jgi:hypothetical protein